MWSEAAAEWLKLSNSLAKVEGGISFSFSSARFRLRFRGEWKNDFYVLWFPDRYTISSGWVTFMDIDIVMDKIFYLSNPIPFYMNCTSLRLASLLFKAERNCIFGIYSNFYERLYRYYDVYFKFLLWYSLIPLILIFRMHIQTYSKSCSFISNIEYWSAECMPWQQFEDKIFTLIEESVKGW